MFERAHELKIMGSTIGLSHSNLSVCFAEIRNVTYAAVADVSQVSVVEYDAKMENISWDTIHVNYIKSDRPAFVSQACLVLPTSRSLPLLVVGTDQGVQIFDVRTTKMISYAISVTTDKESAGELWYKSARGITCSDCLILVGTYTGEIMQFFCNGETSITSKKPLREHTHPIMDLATCKYDEVTCSVDTSGLVIVWHKPMKGAHHRIMTGHTITAINVLRKQVIAGTSKGQLLLYSIVTGELMSTVDAHARLITAISVAPESAYMMSSSEDGRFVIFKLHTRKPQAYQVEYRYSDEVDNGIIVGCQFTTGRGSGVAVACFEKSIINMYRIVKRPAPAK